MTIMLKKKLQCFIKKKMTMYNNFKSDNLLWKKNINLFFNNFNKW